ncbi:hypothetical protein [Guptibacillus hwajinpoensis]
MPNITVCSMREDLIHQLFVNILVLLNFFTSHFVTIKPTKLAFLLEDKL